MTGAVGLQLIRSHGALPLGSRTLFTAVETFGYETPSVNNDSLFARPCLTTINVQLNVAGTLTISTKTSAQDGIRRLLSPQDDIEDLQRTQPGTDVWLCPNGTVARLVSANIESPTVPSPDFPLSGNVNAKKQQWKLDVAQWLLNFGLHINSIDDEPWVEIEVWEPVFAKLTGETIRQSEDSPAPLPLKRILWPARFCFKRADNHTQRLPDRTSWPLGFADDPLDFAERWALEIEPILASHQKPAAPSIQQPPPQPQPKDEEMTSPKLDNLEGFESLARMAQYPDLPPANLVYPTPPDGAAAGGINSTTQTEQFLDEESSNLFPAMPQSQKNTSDARLSPEIGVGSGHYDASDDEDLFGEMKDRNFGSKGITDADFSFFDDPELDGMDDDPPAEQPEEPEQTVLEEEKPQDISARGGGLVNHPPLAAPDVTANPTQEAKPIEENPTIPEPVDEPMKSPSPSGSLPHSEGPTIISPPLSPVEVKKILFSGAQKESGSQASEPRTQQGHYHPVAFEKKIGDWNQKYGATGKFWFNSGSAPDAPKEAPNTIPTIGIPHRARPSVSVAKAKSITGASPTAPANTNQVLSDSDSETSYDSDDMSSESAPSPPTLVSLKRKRMPSESDIQSTMSPAKSVGAPEGTGTFKVENSAFLGSFLANFSDWSFIGFFSSFPAHQLPILVRREDQIPIAQLVVDQITQSSLNHWLGGRIGLFELESENMEWRTCLEGNNFLGDNSKLDLKSYISLREGSQAVAPQPSPRDPPKSSILRIPAPHVRVRRGNKYLEALPPAVSFWDTFGLEPAHGSKDISAYCIHPYAATKAADSFLTRFGLHYQSCNLGSHARGDKSMTFENGMKSWDSESSSYASMMQSLKGVCEELGKPSQPCRYLIVY